MMTIPNIKTLDILYLGTLDPWASSLEPDHGAQEDAGSYAEHPGPAFRATNPGQAQGSRGQHGWLSGIL